MCCEVLQSFIGSDWKEYQKIEGWKNIVVLFLPCLVAFLEFHPYNYVLSYFS